MIIYFAGIKPQERKDEYDDPRECVGHELHSMITYWEFKNKKLAKKKRMLLKNLTSKKGTKNAKS